MRALLFVLDFAAFIGCIALLIPIALVIGAGLTYLLIAAFVEALCN